MRATGRIDSGDVLYVQPVQLDAGWLARLRWCDRAPSSREMHWGRERKEWGKRKDEEDAMRDALAPQLITYCRYSFP